MVEAALARRVHTYQKAQKQFRGRVIWAGGGGGGDGHIPKAGVTSRSDCKTQCDDVQSWNVNDKCVEKGDSYCVDRKLVPDQFHGDNSVPVCHVMHKTDLLGLCQSGPQCENQKDLDSDHPSLDPGPSNDGPRV